MFTQVSTIMYMTTGYARGLLRGVYAFASPAEHWLVTQHHLLVSRDDLRRAAPEGIIAQVSTRELAELLAGIDVPVVNTSSVLRDLPFPRVGTDDRLVGEQAARHLIGCGLHDLAFAGMDCQLFAVEREAGFRATIEQFGCAYHAFIHHPVGVLARERARLLGEWIVSLPKPVGVFAQNDEWALVIATQCRIHGLRVPEDVAIVGADNDDLVCISAHPHLSSVRVPAREVGFHAAQLLSRLMKGEAPPAAPLLLQPTGVEVRASSDVLAIADPETVAALRFIRRHASGPIDVDAVLRVVPICRSALERRFRRFIGRSPLEEIQRVRLERACELLRTTQLAISVVAQASGFGSAEYFTRVFRRELGMTPTAYRAHYVGR